MSIQIKNELGLTDFRQAQVLTEVGSWEEKRLLENLSNGPYNVFEMKGKCYLTPNPNYREINNLDSLFTSTDPVLILKRKYPQIMMQKKLK